MRRHRILRSEDERRLDGERRWRAPLRRAQWSAYWQRFYGGGRSDESIPARYIPIPFDEAVDDMGHALYGCEACDPEVRWEPARRCVSQMLLAGYKPKPRVRPTFDRIAAQTAYTERYLDRGPEGLAPQVKKAKAMEPQPPASEVEDFLISWGEREFDVQGWFRRRPLTADEELAFAGPETRLISIPTNITHRGGAFTVEKKVFLRGDTTPVKWLVNPFNWEQLGQFFSRTQREKDGLRNVEGDQDPWCDVLCEDFIVTWNGFTTYSFRQKLKVDYSVTADVARSDYALMYEQDDQIELNEGFFEIAKSLRHPGWIEGTMCKTLRFTSSVLNMMAPAILSMFLDSQADGFNRLAREVIRRDSMTQANER